MTGGSFAWPPLGDDQRELLALVHTLATERIAPRAAEIDETHEFPWDIVELYPRAGPVRALLRGAPRRHRHRAAARARRDRGGLEGLRHLGGDPRGAGARLARAQARGLGGAAGSLPPPARIGRVARRLRADGVGVGLGLGRDAHDRAARRRRLRAERRQAVHHERRRREPLHRLRAHRSDLEASRHQRLRRRVGLAGLRGRAPRAEARDRRARRPASSSSTTAACPRRT